MTQPIHPAHHLDRYADVIVPSLADGDPLDQLSPEVVAKALHISAATLPGWRNRGVGPPFVRLTPRLVRYPRGLLIAWLRSRNAKDEKNPPPTAKVHAERKKYTARMREPVTPPAKPKHVPDVPKQKQKQPPAVKPVVRAKEHAR